MEGDDASRCDFMNEILPVKIRMPLIQKTTTMTLKPIIKIPFMYYRENENELIM